MVVADMMPVWHNEEVAAKVVEEIVAEAATAETVVKTDVVVAEIAHGAEAINDVEFNESESFDGSNSSEFALKSHNFAIDHEAFFPHSKYFCYMSSIGTEMSATEEFPATEEITAAGIIPAVEVPEVEHMGSEVEVIPSTEIEDDIPDIEGTFAQDPNDNAPLEDMADVHDSYDAVLADVQEENVQAAVPELEVTSPAIKNASPTKTAGSGNEFAAEDEGEFDAVEAAESASAAIQSPFASLERLGAEVDFYDYSVPRDGVQFLEAIWKKYGNFISNFKLGNFVGGAMLTLLCCVLAQMRNTNFDDVTEAKILEWKSVVQELIKEGFQLDFIFEHFPRLLETYLAKGIGCWSYSRSCIRSRNSPQDRDCDLGRCETADFYELLLALMGVHHSFIVASVNIVMIGKECMNVVGTIELIAGAIAEQTYEVWCCSRTSCSRFMILEGDDLAFVVL
uniref:Uncharacterized protein n=1 Tax=Fagus sylvatica TaxID=28930 RepID=A0A2N9I4R1_FAGSY